MKTMEWTKHGLPIPTEVCESITVEDAWGNTDIKQCWNTMNGESEGVTGLTIPETKSVIVNNRCSVHHDKQYSFTPHTSNESVSYIVPWAAVKVDGSYIIELPACASTLKKNVDTGEVAVVDNEHKMGSDTFWMSVIGWLAVGKQNSENTLQLDAPVGKCRSGVKIPVDELRNELELSGINPVELPSSRLCQQ